MVNILQFFSRWLFILLLGTLTACATRATSPIPLKVSEIPPGSGNLAGYLANEELPNSQQILPPPTALRDATMQAADESAYQRGLALRGTERWKIAARDANLHRFPEALSAFACTMGFVPSETETPNLLVLLRRVKTDAVLAVKNAKDAYNRKRPFVAHHANTCEPLDETRLATQGSYPSGHASTGFAWALILAELVPSRRDALLKRGYAFGQSRVVCGYHWQSDVDAGRVIGATTVSALHANATFKAQMEAARREIDGKLAMHQDAPPECAAEREALESALQ